MLARKSCRPAIGGREFSGDLVARERTRDRNGKTNAAHVIQ